MSLREHSLHFSWVNTQEWDSWIDLGKESQGGKQGVPLYKEIFVLFIIYPGGCGALCLMVIVLTPSVFSDIF